MLITVKRSDIRRGKQSDPEQCPIALALVRTDSALNGESVSISDERARIGWNWYNLPRSARRFVKRFDSGKKVAPFRFRLSD